MVDHDKDAEVIFLAALEKNSPQERAALVESACAGKPELRARLRELLASHEDSQGPFDGPPPGLGVTVGLPPLMEQPGSKIGPYKLLEQIGEGGMGLVFVAEQQKPVRRKVALKLIKPGMDTRQVIARFEAERQALALMDHPNIAKVLDAGSTTRRASVLACSDDAGQPPAPATSEDACATEMGRPYFVMELVKGKPITDYCDRNQLGTRQRLELFFDVCQAVQHAHQKGIIHRDLKPSNILVEVHDVRPVVKIIDFGIAKAIGQQLTDKTLHTGIAQMIGTPLYMSPEQAGLSSLDVDTRSDVYALGVLLYELLTGTTPFDGETLKKAGYDEMRRIVREDEPPKPSARLSTLHDQALSTIAEQRGMEPRKLGQQMRGELDWIVMKALEKDRNRRYESASALAADVQRYLKDEPVEACPPSRRYRLGKFLRKHRTGVLTATALLAAALILGAGIGYMVLDQAARRAETDRQRAATELAVNADLTEAEFWWQQKQWAKAIPALERATGRLVGSGLDSLQDRVETRRRDATLAVRLELASVQGAPAWGGEQDVVAVDRAYRSAFKEYGLDVAALTPEESARRIQASAMRIQMVTALDNWAFYLDHRANNKDALHGAGASLRAIAQLADDDDWRRQLRDPRVIKDRVALERLADGEAVTNQSSEYVMILLGLLEQATNGPTWVTLGSGHAGVRMLLRMQQLHPADFWINLSLGLHLSKEPATVADAIGFCRAAVAAQPQNPFVYRILGDNFLRQKKLPEAEAAYRKVIELLPDFAAVHLSLGHVLAQQNKHIEAQAAFRKVEAAYRKGIELNPEDATAYTRLGSALAQQKKHIEAEAAYRKAIEVNPEDATAYLNLGIALLNQNKDPEAEAAYRTAIKLKPNYATAYFYLGGVLIGQSKFAEMEAANRKAIELDPDYWIAYFNLGWALVQQQKYVEAVAAYRKLFDNDPNYSHYPAAMAAALAGCGQGKDTASLDAKERGQLRGQALAWLRAGLTASQKELAEEPDKKGPRVQESMQDLQRDPSFNGVRREDALAKLPEAERWEWHALWQEVEELKRRAEVAREAELRQRLAILAQKQPDDWTTFNTQALLGELLLAQKRYAEAEPLLLEGYEGLKERQANIPAPAKGRVLEALDQLPRLYDAWGQKEKSVRWRAAQEQAERGFVRAWLVLSEPVPYPPGDGVKALDQEQIPGVALLHPRAGDKVEAGGKGLVWKEYHSPERHIDLVALYDGAPSDYRVAYLVCYVHADADRTDLVLRVGSDDQAKVYLNGQEVYRQTKGRALTVDEDEVKPIALRKGSNVVVFKVVNGNGPWAGCLHFLDKDGRPVEGLKFRLTPE